MKRSSWAFTFVELIVVLVIISILSTVWFTVYESYLSTGRDTARVTKLKDINTSLGVYTTKSRIPVPENGMEILLSGSLLMYQGDFTEKIAKTVWFTGIPFDDNLNIYPTLALEKNKKDFQVLTFLEEPTLQQSFFVPTYASTDYTSLYIISIWKSLWVLLDADTKQPLYTDPLINTWNYEILTSTGEVLMYFSDEKLIYSSNGDTITEIIPNKNCRKILDSWKSQWSWKYAINPTWSNEVMVYCDMFTDGWWWTILVNNDNKDDESATTTDCKPRLSWYSDHACGSISESNDFVVNAAGINFTELVFSWYSWKFENMNTYQYMKWERAQEIPPSETFETDPADSWDNELKLKGWINDLRCTSYDPIYLTLQNGAWVYEPHTAIQTSLSWTEREFSFIDDWPSSSTKNTYGLDDYQDGDGCSDWWGNKTYRWSSAYIMVR